MTEAALCHDFDDLEPDISHLEIEDDEPVDNIFSEKQQQLLVDSLDASVSENLRPYVALANVGLFASPHHPPLVPDVMVAFGKEPAGPLTEKKNNTYLIWNYGGPPDIVIELVSNKKGGEDSRKLNTYAKWRVGYCVIYDPFAYLGHRPLRTFQLTGTTYVELIDPFKLPQLNLGFTIQYGEYRSFEGPWLRWVDGQGTTLCTASEIVEKERQRADEERQRADEERQRADALEAKLKALGIDP